MQRIYSVLEVHGEKRGAAQALVCDGVELSYTGLLGQVNRRMSALIDTDLTVSDVVFVTTGRGLDYWIDMLAVWSLGAVAVPLDCKIEWPALAVYIEKAGPTFIVGEVPHADRFGVLSRRDDIHRLARGDDGADHPDDLAAIYFTSGSTGQPKGVMLSGSAIWGNARAVTGIIPITEDDRLLVVVPFHFTSTICHFLASVVSGSTLVLTEGKALYKDVIELMNRSEISALGGAPLHLKWLLECDGEVSSTLRWVMSSGDVLPVDTIIGFHERLPHVQVITVYGLTEVGGRLTILTHDELQEHMGSVGRPLPGMTVSGFDEEGKVLKPGQEGEMVVSGEFLFDGYTRDEDNNKKSFLGNAFKTGDIGTISSEGYVYLLGRNDDVFKVGGRKVSAAWIASELSKTGLFEDVAVVGKDFSGFGNIPWACYVLKEGAEFSRFKVNAALREHLPLNHIPQQYVEVPHVPRTGSGKVNRKQLRAMIDEAAS